MKAWSLGWAVVAGCGLLAACTESDPADGTGGAPTGGIAGAGGTTGDDCSGGHPTADDATTHEQCHYQGCGGDDCYHCNDVTLELSNPLSLAELEVELETSLGDTWDAVETTPVGSGSPWLEAVGDPVSALLLRQGCPSTHYAPEWIDLVLTHGGVEVANERVDSFSYSCVAYTGDNWCWESTPVTVSVSTR